MENKRRAPDKPDPNAEDLVRIRASLSDLSQLMLVAMDAYQEHPMWHGMPGPDVGSSHWRYPIGDKIKSREEAIALHVVHIKAAADGFLSAGADAPSWQKKGERANNKIDRVRASLRNQHRLDSESLLTTRFGLLTCVPVGKPIEDQQASVTEDMTSLPMCQRYEYRMKPEKQDEVHPKLMALIKELSTAIKSTFDDCARVLLKGSKIGKHDIDFLKLAVAKNGEIYRVDVVAFLKARGVRCSGPSDPASVLLRKYCDKQGAAYTRTPWLLRPEARSVLENFENNKRGG